MASKSFNVVEFMVNTHGDAFKKEKVIAGPLPKSKAQAMRDKLTDKLPDFKPEEPILSYVLVPA